MHCGIHQLRTARETPDINPAFQVRRGVTRYLKVHSVRGTRLKSRLTCRNLLNALRTAQPAPTNSKYVLCRKSRRTGQPSKATLIGMWGCRAAVAVRDCAGLIDVPFVFWHPWCKAETCGQLFQQVSRHPVSRSDGNAG